MARLNNLPKNEFGFSICQYQDGQLAAGPLMSGTPTSVQVPLTCPPGAKLRSIFHTHPGGAAYPSDTDIQSTLKAGLDTLCIQNDAELRCFRLLNR